MNVNQQLFDDKIERARLIRQYEALLHKRTYMVLNGHKVRVDKIVQDAGRSVKGLKTLHAAIDTELTKTYKEAYQVSKRGLLDIVSDQVSYTYQSLDNAASKLWRTKRPGRRVSEEIVLQRPLVGDKTLEAAWGGVSKNEKVRMESIIRKGISDGLTNKQIALDIRRGSMHKISRNQSTALVTTAVTSVTNQADNQVYKANEKLLRGYEYVSILDSRTTGICRHRDGNIYPIDDLASMPPAHINCRSTTTPAVKSWNDLSKMEGVAEVRRRNLKGLSKKQKEHYDGALSLNESYDTWLHRQPVETQLKHLGDYKKMQMFQAKKLDASDALNSKGEAIGMNTLRAKTDEFTAPNDTHRFASAKARLDSMRLHATTPDDFINDKELSKTLKDYYLLQDGNLDGNLSLLNYRGLLLPNKKATKRRIMESPPLESQMVFNPITRRYEDVRRYRPNPGVYANALHRVDTSDILLQKDKDYINKFVKGLDKRMSMNTQAVVADNLRITFGRFRKNGEQWGNFKGVTQAQLKFDITNISEAIETDIRTGSDSFKKLKLHNYHDPVLGPTSLKELSDNFVSNIHAKNLWEDRRAPKIARKLRDTFDRHLPPKVWVRLDNSAKKQFYLKFAHRLALADGPDRDGFAVALGKDLYNLGNMRGTRQKWYAAGMKILESNNDMFTIDSMGTPKRRMKSRMSGQYFGPAYDVAAFNIRVTEPSIMEYARLSRAVDVGIRVGVTNEKNKLYFREGYKTYFLKNKLGIYTDTRIPITSSSSFGDFPPELVDKGLVDALNHTSRSEYRIDPEFYDFSKKLLYFQDDRGRAAHYNARNFYKEYLAERGDTYERFKAMEYFRGRDAAFSNPAFVDHRLRVYERGLISPQSGETFLIRPSA